MTDQHSGLNGAGEGEAAGAQTVYQVQLTRQQVAAAEAYRDTKMTVKAIRERFGITSDHLYLAINAMGIPMRGQARVVNAESKPDHAVLRSVLQRLTAQQAELDRLSKELRVLSAKMAGLKFDIEDSVSS